MRVVGCIVVAWLLLQVYPHIRIDFAPTQKEAEVKAPEKERVKLLDDGLMDYYPAAVIVKKRK